MEPGGGPRFQNKGGGADATDRAAARPGTDPTTRRRLAR